MKLVVSPYHITLQELPALAASLLGSRLVTYLPVPGDIDRANVRRVMGTSPRYLRLLESWRWAAPLFRAGVLSSLDAPAPTAHASPEGADPLVSVRRADARLRDDARFGELKSFHHASLFEPERTYLDAVSSDMLKAGPDPGVSVPIAAGLDAFAASRDFVAMRSGGAVAPRAGSTGPSLAQRVESVLGESLLSFSMPVLSAADGSVILDVREELHQELEQLREALRAAIREVSHEGHAPREVRSAAQTTPAGLPASSQAEVREAASHYARAFDILLRNMLGTDEGRGRRITGCTVSVVCKRMSVDAAFVSSVAALRQAGSRGSIARRGLTAQPIDSDAPARLTPRTTGRLLTFVISQMNSRAGRAAPAGAARAGPARG